MAPSDARPPHLRDAGGAHGRKSLSSEGSVVTSGFEVSELASRKSFQKKPLFTGIWGTPWRPVRTSPLLLTGLRAGERRREGTAPEYRVRINKEKGLLVLSTTSCVKHVIPLQGISVLGLRTGCSRRCGCRKGQGRAGQGPRPALQAPGQAPPEKPADKLRCELRGEAVRTPRRTPLPAASAEVGSLRGPSAAAAFAAASRAPNAFPHPGGLWSGFLAARRRQGTPGARSRALPGPSKPPPPTGSPAPQGPTSPPLRSPPRPPPPTHGCLSPRPSPASPGLAAESCPGAHAHGPHALRPGHPATRAPTPALPAKLVPGRRRRRPHLWRAARPG